MKIENFEATGLEKLAKWLQANNINSLSEPDLRELLKTVNISFVMEELNRLQSTLICELKDSYVQQSQRYVTVTDQGYLLPQLETTDRLNAENLIKRTLALYQQMSQMKQGEFKGRPKLENYEYGIPIEDARYILPLAVKTNVCVALAGDKLIDFVNLLNKPDYRLIFADLLGQLLKLLPSNIAELVQQHYQQVDNNLVGQYYAAYLQLLSPENNLILLETFSDLDMKVGFGALTSTMQQPPSAAITRWGAEAPQKAQGVVERVLSYGHDSIAEQARVTVGMMCSLVTYHQQLRHRLTANYREPLESLVTDLQRAVKIPSTIATSPFAEEFLQLVAEIKTFRAQLLQKYDKATALFFLLNCEQLKIVMSTNARADISMLADRTCRNAQWEIRELAIKKLICLRKLSPVLYEKALPSCVWGKCREGKLTCGQQLQVREQFSKLLD